MRLTKAFGLAALAVVATMAFMGTSSAGAQVHEIALCKVLEKLCAAGNLWPSGTEVLLLAPNPELVGNFTIKCPDSLIVAVTNAAVGNPLSATIKSVEFGKLPTPLLGEGCSGCPFGLKTEVHLAAFVPFTALVKVKGEDEYTLLVENGKAIVKCGSIECGFEGKDIETGVIKHDGKHEKHPGAENLALAEINKVLTVFKDTSGLGTCGKTATWHANYTLTLAHFGGASGLAWPSLDIK